MSPDREETLTLELLNAIEAKSDVTQRHLADRLGVALGLANSYLKRCVRKGLVKISQAPANRYLYYLTPTGFAEKSRLTAEYFSYSFDFYRRASLAMGVALGTCEERGWRRVLLMGISELAEIASVRCHDYQLELIGTLAAKPDGKTFLSRPVWHDLPPRELFDGALLTALSDGDVLLAAARQCLEPSDIVIPELVVPLLHNSHPIDALRAAGART